MGGKLDDLIKKELSKKGKEVAIQADISGWGEYGLVSVLAFSLGQRKKLPPVD